MPLNFTVLNTWRCGNLLLVLDLTPAEIGHLKTWVFQCCHLKFQKQKHCIEKSKNTSLHILFVFNRRVREDCKTRFGLLYIGVTRCPLCLLPLQTSLIDQGSTWSDNLWRLKKGARIPLCRCPERPSSTMTLTLYKLFVLTTGIHFVIKTEQFCLRW